MSDDFDDLLKRWLRQRAGDDRAAMRALAGNVAVLPPRRNRQRELLPLVASVAVLIGLGWLLSPRLASVTNEAASTPSAASASPGDPAAFANDPRLGQCFGTIANMEFAFEIEHARDYRSYLPEMGISPELEVDAPTLVVVYRDGTEGPMSLGGPGPRPTPLPGRRFVCVVPANGPANVYVDVDITGLRMDTTPSSPGPTEPAPTPELAPTEPLPSGQTPTPAPAWYAGADVLLQCDGRPLDLGPGWRPEELDDSPSSDAETALARVLDRARREVVPLPTSGYQIFEATGDGEAFTYIFNGAIRAVVVARSDGPNGAGSWRVASAAACEPGEYNGDLPIGAVAGIWRDAAGVVASPDVVTETVDCYGGRMLRVDGRLFVWDPSAGADQIYDPAQLEAAFAADADLPLDTVDTGYSSSGRQLALAADGSAAYIVIRDAAERWPHVKGDDYQRIDCN
jgi:hypothetical protein